MDRINWAIAATIIAVAVIAVVSFLGYVRWGPW